MNSYKKKLSLEQYSALLNTLKVRFEKNSNRHKGFEWADVEANMIVQRKVPQAAEAFVTMVRR